jgi:hypothetical protein
MGFLTRFFSTEAAHLRRLQLSSFGRASDLISEGCGFKSYNRKEKAKSASVERERHLILGSARVTKSRGARKADLVDDRRFVEGSPLEQLARLTEWKTSNSVQRQV